jgi:hypothetical protein
MAIGNRTHDDRRVTPLAGGCGLYGRDAIACGCDRQVTKVVEGLGGGGDGLNKEERGDNRAGTHGEATPKERTEGSRRQSNNASTARQNLR